MWAVRTSAVPSIFRTQVSQHVASSMSACTEAQLTSLASASIVHLWLAWQPWFEGQDVGRQQPAGGGLSE
jgi:hypothetical protein